MAVRVFSPAKINLSLAITGRRADGFHELVSVVAPLAFGDVLWAEATGEAAANDASRTTLTCDDATLAVDESNLVWKAARVFRAATGWTGGVALRLEKRIPVGAGLGGGSSNAVATLRALREVSGVAVSASEMMRLAAELGSDCPLFLAEGPVVMRGRGERVERLPDAAAARLRGRRVLVFKPAFGIATAWAYARLAERVRRGELAYAEAAEEEARWQAWLADERAPAEALAGNTFEPVAFAKFVALPAMLGWLREKFGVVAHMSGSGSACFALLPAEADVAALRAAIREGWGESAWVVETTLA